MSKNLGTIVSRVLDSKDRNFQSVVFQQKRPPLDSEFNLFQDIYAEKFSDLIKKITPSGFLDLENLGTAPESRSALTSNWANALVLKNKTAIVNGWILHLGGGTNQFQPNSSVSIWEDLSGNEDEMALICDEAPHIGYREDLVFLEVWQKLVKTTDLIYKYGFVQSSLDPLTNDLIDSNIEIETTKRIQIQYRLRIVKGGIDFWSYRNGLGSPACFARGPLDSENNNYIYSKHSTDKGLWIAGNGDQVSIDNLQTVDGYVYAIPVARVHRRNQGEFNFLNQNGSNVSLTSGTSSDRPDGLFYDEISSRDVEDLRHQITLTAYDYSRLLEENVNMLWNKTLPRELKNSELAENLAGNVLLQIDGISSVTRAGIDDSYRDPDGFKRSFSESREVQIVTKYIPASQNGTSVWYNNKLWFIPKSISGRPSYEQPLWDERKFFTYTETPKVYTYNESTKTISAVTGGSWVGLGEERTWDYIPNSEPLKSTVTFQPVSAAALQGKDMIIMFKFVAREGGGLDDRHGGLNYPISKMLYGKNDKDGLPVDFSNVSEKTRVVTLENTRTQGSYTDSALTISIKRFEQIVGITPSEGSLTPDNERIRGASLEVKYHLTFTDTEMTIPAKVYGRNVISVYSILNLSSQEWMYSFNEPSIEKLAGGGFKISGLTGTDGDILQVTLLCGNYKIDYVSHTHAVKSVASTFTSVNKSISVGDIEGIANAYYSTSGVCDAVLATAGFFNGYEYRPICYINNKMIRLKSIENLGTPVIKYTLLDEISGSPYSGTLNIPIFGYYNPSTSDKFYFEYEHIPYAGILKNRMLSNATIQVKILKVDDKITILTSGSGSEDQYVPNELKGISENLPICKKVLDYNFFGENIVTPITGGNSSFRRLSCRSFGSSTETYLKEGETITLKKGISTNNTEMERGIIIDSPKILERGFDLTTPVNHMSQWTAIVEGQGDLAGELFLMVITTVSTKYNQTEAVISGKNMYSYLEQKSLYNDNAFGKASEVILNNNLTSADMSIRLGEKIIGSVDLFPLKYRPLNNN